MAAHHSPVSTSTRQHFVDTQHVERMHTNTHVELVFSTMLHHVLVSTDTACLQSLTGQLFVLIRHQMDGHGEVVHRDLLGAQVIYSYLWVCSVDKRYG